MSDWRDEQRGQRGVRAEASDPGSWEARAEAPERGQRSPRAARPDAAGRSSRGQRPTDDAARETVSDTEGFDGLFRSFGHAFAGIGRTIARERNMRIHVVVAVLAVVACALLRCTPVEWAIVIVLIALVFAAELFNTAIEAAVDLETRGRRHPLAKKAKDAAAGAVLVLAICAVVAGLVVYITAFVRLLG